MEIRPVSKNLVTYLVNLLNTIIQMPSFLTRDVRMVDY